MATPRKSPYEKALSRALKLQVRSMFVELDGEGELRRVDSAWQKVVELHQPPEGCPDDCEWCARFVL